MHPKLSILVPVYNSSHSVEELCARIQRACTTLGETYEIILVNDGSTDASWETIEQLKKNDRFPITAVNLTRNYGQHNALLCGFSFCQGECVITMDDDLQNPPEEIAILYRKYLETYADVVYGVTNEKKHSLVRNAGSRFVSATSEYNEKGKPNKGSSFRLMRRELVDEIRNNFHHNFLYLDAVINWLTGSIEYVEVEHHARRSGKSGYSTFKLVSLYMSILINYSATPLRYMIYGGLLASGLSFLFAVHFIYRKLMHNVPLGYTSLIVSILFSTGLIMFCLGIIGQYLYKMYRMQSKQPPYLIKKTLR